MYVLCVYMYVCVYNIMCIYVCTHTCMHSHVRDILFLQISNSEDYTRGAKLTCLSTI